MNNLKKSLDYPLSKTLVIIGVAFAAVVLMSVSVLFIQRLLLNSCGVDVGSELVCRGPLLLNVGNTILSDMSQLARLALDVSVLFLAAQLLVRFFRKF